MYIYLQICFDDSNMTIMVLKVLNNFEKIFKFFKVRKMK